MNQMAYSRGFGGLFRAAAVVFASLTVYVGCSGDGNPTPTGSFTGGAGGTTSEGGAGGTTSQGGGGEGGAGGAACEGPNGCYSCKPATNVQFLNACTGAQCSKFDDAARLPLYNNGNLPELP